MKYLIVLFLSFSLYAYADHEHEEHERYEHHHVSKELSHLQLTPTQYERLKRILSRYRESLKTYRRFKEETEAKRDRLFLQDDLNITAVKALQESLDARAREIERRFLRDMHTLLTPQQRQSFLYYFDDWEVH